MEITHIEFFFFFLVDLKFIVNNCTLVDVSLINVPSCSFGRKNCFIIMMDDVKNVIDTLLPTFFFFF